MNQTKKHKEASLIFFMLFSLAGMLLSLVSLYDHSRLHYAALFGLEAGKSFCNIGPALNCDAVNVSKWSYILGMPVASYGVLFYFLLFSLGAAAKSEKYISGRISSGIFLVLSLFGVAFSVYLFLISTLAIKTYCIVCLALYAVNLIVFGSAYFHNPAGESFAARLNAGISALISFPLLIFELREEDERTSAARMFMLLLFSAGTAAFFLPEGMFLKVALPRMLASAPEKIAEKWAKAEKEDIKLALTEGEDRDYYRGSPEAPIKVVEFADFECPACQQFYIVMHELLEKYRGKVFYVFKNYPLSSACNPGMRSRGHENACFAARLSRCAGAEGKYWEMADYLFGVGLKYRGKKSSEEMRELMKKGINEIGLDKNRISQCIRSKIHDAKLRADIKEGNRLGLRGTPAIWVNGRPVRNISYKALEAIFNSILNGIG